MNQEPMYMKDWLETIDDYLKRLINNSCSATHLSACVRLGKIIFYLPTLVILVAFLIAMRRNKETSQTEGFIAEEIIYEELQKIISIIQS